MLPTVPALLEALTTRATSVLEKLDRLPIEQIGNDLGQALAGANAVINSRKLRGAVDETQAALAAVRKTAEHLDGEIAPQLSAALRVTSTTMKYAGDIVALNSPSISRWSACLGSWPPRRARCGSWRTIWSVTRRFC